MSIKDINPETIATVMRECSEKYIMPRYKTLEDHEIATKERGPDDLVTIADRETEEALNKILPDILPGSIVLGEEAVSEKRISTDILGDTSQTIWVVDPVDGTYNFRHGKRHFAVMIALVHGGEAVGGWIYDPLGNRIMMTQKGAGTTIDGQTIRIASKDAGANLKGYAYKDVRSLLSNSDLNLESLISMRCAGHEYFNILTGESDFALCHRTRPWDHLPGTLAVIEAGGKSCKWNDTPYTPTDEWSHILTACDADVWQQIQNHIPPLSS